MSGMNAARRPIPKFGIMMGIIRVGELGEMPSFLPIGLH
jgi:hypothetical protein